MDDEETFICERCTGEFFLNEMSDDGLCDDCQALQDLEDEPA